MQNEHNSCLLSEAIADPSARTTLAEFIDPQRFTGPLRLKRDDASTLQNMLTGILLIRYAEEAIAELVRSAETRCPCHLGIGQEAIAVGASLSLHYSDKIFGAHRSHAHYLALGGDLDALMAEVLGKDSGCSKGMGGSMHLRSPEVGFCGSVPIVGATIPIAVGAALAAKMDGVGGVAVSYFGDGACEEGVFHESLNLAAVQKLPVFFIAENNLYSSHLDIALRQPSDLLSRFATAHRITALLVDGNDVLAVRDAARHLIRLARAGRGPVFMECVTYRWRGHVGPDENIDVGLRRKAEDLEAWKKRDPLARLAQAMQSVGILSEHQYEELRREMRQRVAQSVARARAGSYPPESALLSRVFAPSQGASV